MNNNSPISIERNNGVIILVFAGLITLTVFTVSLSLMPFGAVTAICIALLLASIKGGLVAAYFMHLAHERPSILAIMALTLFLVASLAGVLLWSPHSVIEGTTASPLQPIENIVASGENE